MKNPSSKEIKKARIDAGLSQTAASALIYKNLRTWQQWEAGHRKTDVAFWKLFLLKVPTLTIKNT